MLIKPKLITAIPPPTNRPNGVIAHLPSSNYNNPPTSTSKVFTTKTALLAGVIPTYPTLVSTLTLTMADSALIYQRTAARATLTTRNCHGHIILALVRFFISFNKTF